MKSEFSQRLDQHIEDSINEQIESHKSETLTGPTYTNVLIDKMAFKLAEDERKILSNQQVSENQILLCSPEEGCIMIEKINLNQEEK